MSRMTAAQRQAAADAIERWLAGPDPTDLGDVSRAFLQGCVAGLRGEIPSDLLEATGGPSDLSQ